MSSKRISGNQSVSQIRSRFEPESGGGPARSPRQGPGAAAGQPPLAAPGGTPPASPGRTPPASPKRAHDAVVSRNDSERQQGIQDFGRMVAPRASRSGGAESVGSAAGGGALRVGELVGQGSYKAVYDVQGEPGKVVAAVDSSKRSLLSTEVNNLERLSRAGVRTVQIESGLLDLSDSGLPGQVGVKMEKLQGVEVKEARFGMRNAKERIAQAADGGIGRAAVIDQLEKVDAFVQKNGGISDLQFMVSEDKGLVLFDPATLGTAEKNAGPRQMINHLRKPK